MNRERFNVEQIVAVLKQAKMGTAVSNRVHHVGIAEQMFYRWKQWYAGLESEQVWEFKQLQDENTKLKRLNAHWFESLQDVHERIKVWRLEYYK